MIIKFDSRLKKWRTGLFAEQFLGTFREPGLPPGISREALTQRFADIVELVPVRELIPYREFFRSPSNDFIEKISEEGIREAVIIGYHAPSCKTLLVEGSHRLATAEILGIEFLPARVDVSFGGHSREAKKGTPAPRCFPSIDPDFQDVPQSMKPPAIGFTGTK